MMDYRKMLKAYISLIICEEGTDFMGYSSPNDFRELTEAEFEELKRIGTAEYKRIHQVNPPVGRNES